MGKFQILYYSIISYLLKVYSGMQNKTWRKSNDLRKTVMIWRKRNDTLSSNTSLWALCFVWYRIIWIALDYILEIKVWKNFSNTKVPKRKILRRYGKSNDTLGTRNDLKLLTLMVLRSLPVSKVPKTIQMSNFRRFCVPSVSFDFSYLFKIFRYGTFKFKKCFSNLEVQYRKI